MSNVLWDWVNAEQSALTDAGHVRLAALIDEVVDCVSRDDGPRADALAPEALALARSLNSPWLEVYFRHWHLQSRVLSRGEGLPALSEAIDLVDFAHRPAAASCPQSVCTVQDLSACYGNVDGPGYFEDRRRVIEETLARIEPSRSCFKCLSAQLADGLIQAERFAEVLAYIDRAEAAQLAAGVAVQVLECRVDALIGLGRFQEALDVNAAYGAELGSPTERLFRRIRQAHALAALGRAEEARAALPEYAEVSFAARNLIRWLDAVHALVRAGAYDNDEALGVLVQRSVRHLDSVGSNYDAVRLTAEAVELAVARRARAVARLLLEAMGPRIERLHVSLHGERLRAKAQALLEALAVDAAPPDGPREQGLEQALAAGNEGVIESARRLAELGFVDESARHLRAAFDRGERADALVMMLGHVLIERARPGELDAFLVELDQRPESASTAAFLRGLRAQRDGALVEASAHFRVVLAHNPEAQRSRSFLVRNAIDGGRFEEALALVDDAVARGCAHAGLYWEQLSAAAALARWDVHARAAAALELEVSESDGTWPVERMYCWIERRTRDDRVFVRRTGPVTGEVLSVTSPRSGRQRRGDRVVYRAEPLEAPRGNPPLYAYREVHVVAEGGFQTYALDGAHPGEARLDALSDAVSALGGDTSVRSAEAYEVKGPGGTVLPGVYLLVAVPASVSPAAVRAAIEGSLAGAEHPLCSLALAQAIGDAAYLAEVQAALEVYGLDGE